MGCESPWCPAESRRTGHASGTTAEALWGRSGCEEVGVGTGFQRICRAVGPQPPDVRLVATPDGSADSGVVVFTLTQRHPAAEQPVSTRRAGWRALRRHDLHDTAPQEPRRSPLPSRLPSSHTSVKRACPLGSRWSAPLDERPGPQGAGLLGFAWDDGRRDGSSLHQPRPEPAGWTVAIPVSGRAPAGGIALSQMPGCWSSPFMPPGLSPAGARAGSRAGAGRRQERRRERTARAPGGA